MAEINRAPGKRFATRLRATGDEPHYLLMAQSLWREGDLDLRDNFERRDYLEYTPGPVTTHYGTPRRDGRPFPAHSPGLPFALAPLYAIGGRPFSRYPDVGPGLLTIEAGCVLASPAPGAGEVEAGFLQAGPAAVAMHAGPYDKLQETYAAMEQWIDGQGLRTGGAPWESYVTDPAEHPDTSDWRTQVFWPIAK